MSGLILPAGSPLVQFELTHLAHGGKGAYNLPALIWVDRTPSDPVQFCPAGRILFDVKHMDGGSIFPVKEGHRAAVCACMGRFAE